MTLIVTPVADGRPVLRHRPALAGRPAASSPEGTPGAIRIRGTVYDGAGEPVPDALVETWQADPDGRFTTRTTRAAPTRRLPRLRPLRAPTTRAAGAVNTVKPGPVPGPGGATQAPHIDVSVFARGLLNRVVTRIYFADEERQRGRPGARAVPADRARDADRRSRRATTATASTSASRATDETVFFAV